MAQPSIGVIVVTWRAVELIEACLEPVLASPLRPRVLVVNSSSNDGTVEKARALGAETWVVPRVDFNHGATREAARKRLGTDVVVMLTPDAHATDAGFLGRLVHPILKEGAAVAYGRQLPRPGAGPIEALNRAFNYPNEPETRSASTRAERGASNHFCSNACAAWSQEALDAIGGFATTLVSEETIAAALLLEQGRTIAYAADAEVVHSHPTGLWGDFRRQFDVGLTRAVFQDVLLVHERDEVRGRAYASTLLAGVLRQRPALLPYALLDTAARYLGYRLGRAGERLPRRLAAALSGQDFFWGSSHEDAFFRGGAEAIETGGERFRDAA